jgi:hypothetical protein
LSVTVFVVEFICQYAMVCSRDQYGMHSQIIAFFYFYTAVLVGGSSIYFIRQIKRNFGAVSFQVPIRNVTIITSTVICSFCYSSVFLFVRRYIQSTSWLLSLWNVQYLVGEALPLLVIMIIHRTTLRDQTPYSDRHSSASALLTEKDRESLVKPTPDIFVSPDSTDSKVSSAPSLNSDN